MKTIKSKYRVLTYIICFSFLAVTQISCENNDNLEEIIEQSAKEKTTTKTIAKANIKANRTKLKQRRNGLYKTSVVVNNDTENLVNTVAVTVEKKDGFIKETKTYILTPNKNDKEKNIFSFDEIKFENDKIVNQEITVHTTLLDANNRPLSETITDIVTVIGNLKFEKIVFNKKPNGLYTALATVKNDTKNDFEKITVTVEKGKGIANKTITYDLTYLKTEKGVKYYTNQKVVLVESNVKKIPVVIQAKIDGDGTGMTVITRVRARRYKGRRGE